MKLPTVCTQKVQLYLLFYKPKADDPIQNRLVALFDGPFCHVEIAFPERYGEEPWERLIWGSSIYQNEPVFFRQKTYQRDGYVSIALEVSLQQLQRIRAYCVHHAQTGTPFNVYAMYAAYLPFQFVHTRATFCSKHVACALQSGDVLTHVNPSLTTPSKLFHLVRKDAILQVVPSRMLLRLPPAPDDRHVYNNNNNNNNNTNEKGGGRIAASASQLLAGGMRLLLTSMAGGGRDEEDDDVSDA